MKKFSIRLSLTALVLLGTFGSKGQNVITTIAGSGGTGGYSGDNGPATAAILNNPSDLVTDASDNIYFTDFGNNVVRKINASGVITTIAGTGFGASTSTTGGGAYTGDGGPATAADLNGPFGLAFDGSGNLYFADGYNHVVRKVSTSGIITTFAGKTTKGFSGDGGPATAAELNNPVGIAVDKAGNVFIADDHNNVIRKVNTSGMISTVAGNTIAGHHGDGGPATAAELSLPIGIAFDTAGNLFIADSRNNRVRKINSLGIISTFAGDTLAGYTGDGALAVNAKLDSPERISFDASNNLYISDYYNNVIRKVDAITGIITTIAGDGTGAGTSGSGGGFTGDDGPATAAQLHLPHGIAFNTAGNMLIADRANNIIRKVGPAPVIDHSGVNNICRSEPMGLNIYPNPAHTGSFTLSLVSANNEVAQVRITNVLGATIKRFTMATNQQMSVKLDEPKGIYFISAITNTGSWSKQVGIE